MDLENQMRPFKRARRVGPPSGGWLRAMRQATGMPVRVIAGEMDFTEKMVYQLERSEELKTISLGRLEEMARALDCDLVYGLAPWGDYTLFDKTMDLLEKELWRKRYERAGIKR